MGGESKLAHNNLLTTTCSSLVVVVVSGVKSILKLHISNSIVTDGKTTRSKVESID